MMNRALGLLVAVMALLAAMADEKEGDGSEVADNSAYEATLAKRPKKSVIDTNTVVRLGFELPDRTLIGKGTSNRLYVKGILAQCAIGEPKYFELAEGGALILGGAGFRFDSNYAHGRTNDVVFSGGKIANFENSYIRSAAPISLTGTVRITTPHRLVLRAGFRGAGSIVKLGTGLLGLQYPCDEAKGMLKVATGTLLLGPTGTWGGTVHVCRGATLKVPSLTQIAKLEKEPGAHVVELGTTKRGDFSSDVFPQPTTAYDVTQCHREKLGRGLFAFRLKEDVVRVSWRYKSSDPADAAFHVYRDGKRITSKPVSDVTYFDDRFVWDGKPHKYEVRSKSEEVHKAQGTTHKALYYLKSSAKIGYFDIELKPPKDSVTPDGHAYSYVPYDCSVGDLDADGEYELIIIWWPSLAGDNASWYQTGETWLEGVKLDGTNRSLWKINLGPNIRSGSHYVPVMVADFDGDGSAEVMCRTANGTMDGKRRILKDGVFALGNTFKDGRAEDLHLVFEPNYLTCFSGRTGVALDTIPYKPAVHDDPKVIERKDRRAVCRFWRARNPGNQAFRFLAAVGYLDGAHLSAIFCRGYYSRTYLAAYDFDGKNLKERWFFSSEEEEHIGYGGQGFHNLRVGDIDFDGRDEIVYGHMCVDHDGQGLWTTGYGHGDALHLIQASPETRGLEVWTCHEAAPYGVSLIEAQTGRTLLRREGPQDTGSCNALDIDPKAPGVELFSGCHCGIYSAKTLQRYMGPKPRPKNNYYGTLRFGIWWMGDMTRSAYSGGAQINGYSTRGRSVWEQWNGGTDVDSNHGSKGCPCLIADILGDWREEILLRRKDNKAIRLFMSPEETPYRFHTFMEDPVYRHSVTTQNCGYNVPSDTGFYFGPDLLGHNLLFRGTQLK